MTDKVPNTKESSSTRSQSPTKTTQNRYPNTPGNKQLNSTSLQISKTLG